MATVALYRTTYHGPTDTLGARITVRDMMTGARRVIPFDYSARNAATSAVSHVTGVAASAVEYVGEDSRGKYYALTFSVVGGGE